MFFHHFFVTFVLFCSHCNFVGQSRFDGVFSPWVIVLLPFFSSSAIA